MKNYLITTERLGLRLLSMNDLDQLAELNADAEVRKFFPDGTQDREQAAMRMKERIAYYESHKIPSFTMENLETHEFIGRCGFGFIETGEIEVGYIICQKFWNQGYASEALNALLTWAKKHIKADYIIAFTPVEHIASQRVMQKCGMEYYQEAIGHGVLCRFYRVSNRE